MAAVPIWMLIPSFADILNSLDEVFAEFRLRRELRASTILRSVAARLLRQACVPAAALRAFVCEFACALPALQTLEAQGRPSALPPLRLPCLVSATRFRGVEVLVLREILFFDFRDFTRFICAFPNLRRVHLDCVSWRGNRCRSLFGEPFAKMLRLKEIMVSAQR